MDCNHVLGLSSICLASSLLRRTQPSQLITCDIDKDALDVASKYIAKANLSHIVQLYHMKASDL